MIVISLSFSSTKRKYTEEQMRDENYQTDYTRLLSLYNFFVRFPLTSKSTNQLKDILSGLSLYNDIEQRAEVARISSMSYLLTVVVISAVVVATEGNLLFCIASFIVILAFRRDFVNKRLSKMRLKFWKELLVTLTSLQQEYMRTRSLNNAMTSAQVQPSTQYMMGNLEYMMKSEDPEGSLNYFCTNNSYHVCIRLAYLIYTTSLFSAAYIEKEGIDSFVDGLDSLIADLTIDIDIAAKEKKKFYTAEKLPLVGLILSFAGPWFLEQYFPGLRYYYNDGFGFLCKIISLACVVGSYMIATRLNDHDRSQEDIAPWELRYFQNPKNYTKWWARCGSRETRFNIILERSLSYLHAPALMMRKAIYGISGLFIGVALCVGYTLVEEWSLTTNYRTVPQTIMDAISAQYEDYNIIFETAYNDPSLVDETQYLTYVKSIGVNLSEVDAGILAKQLSENKAKILKISITPMFLLIGLFVMFITYNLPDLLLNRRAKMIDYEAKFEVILLQAVVCQLMYTPLKLKDYLIFFAAVSRLYKGAHMLNYVRHFNSPQYIKEDAYKMRDPNYYLLMEQLYTLHSTLTPMQVFRQTASQRKYLSGKLLESREEALEANYAWLKALTNAGLWVPVILEIILPVASFVMETLSQYMSMIPE
jgi:hypothetical protein